VTKTMTRTIASALADILVRVEECSRAHDALTIPETDDVAVDWEAAIGQVDVLGEAVHQLVLIGRDRLIPNLKAIKTHAQSALEERATLERLVAGEVRPSSPMTDEPDELILIPAGRPARSLARARVQCQGTAYDRDAAGQKIGPPRQCRNKAPAADPYCGHHGWQKP
jgi:hypothetical protein